MNYKLILKVAGAVAVAVVAVVFCIGCSSDDEEDNYGTIYGKWEYKTLLENSTLTTTYTYKRNGTFESSNIWKDEDAEVVMNRQRGTYSTNGTTITTTISDIYLGEIAAALTSITLIYSGPDGPRFSEGWYNRDQYRRVFLEGCKTVLDYYKDMGVCVDAERTADERAANLGPTTQNYSVDGNTLTICPLDYTNIAQCTDYTRK